MAHPELHSRDDHAPDLAAVDVLTVLQALSDPVRLAIVRQLAGCTGEAGLMCGQIAAARRQVDGEPSPQDAAQRGHHRASAQQGVCKYIQLRRAELDERFPGLLDSVLSAPATPVA